MTSTTVHSVRRHDDDTLFVRLSPEFAWELFQAADRTVDGDWKLPNQPDSVYTASGIEFLPLKLTCGDEVTYASYNGGDAGESRMDRCSFVAGLMRNSVLCVSECVPCGANHCCLPTEAIRVLLSEQC